MSFNALFALVSKDLRIFLRSKISAVVVILIPLLIVLFAGFAFNSSGLSNIHVGVYSDSYSEFTNDVISDFEEEGFILNKYPSVDFCVESVKHSESQICAVFPAGLTSDISTDEIVFYADYSRINLADNLIGQMKGNVAIKTSGVSENIFQSLIDSLEEVKASLPASKMSVDEIIADAKNSKDKSSNLEAVSGISNIISDLNKVKKNINVNDTGPKADIGNIVIKLEEIKTSNDKLSEDLENLADSQEVIVSNLNSVSSDLNKIIVTLNSHRSVNAQSAVSPIKTRIESISADSNNRDYMVPMILSLIALFGAILLSSTFVLKSKKTKAFFRNFMTPTNDFTFAIATYFTCMIILFVQFLIVFLGMKFILGMDLLPIICPLLSILFVALSAFVAIGMFIGYLFRSDETIIFASMIIAALFMFFSNVILPLENVSSELLSILRFNPLVVSNLAMKKIVLFRLGFDAIINELLILAGFFVVFFVLSYIFRRITRRIL